MSQAIDAHQHFWKLDRGDYRWLTPDIEPLYRDFLPQHLRPLLRRAGIGKTVLVQAADTLAETRYLLSLAEQVDFVAAVVGWIDMEDANAPETLAELAENPNLVGIRPMIQDIPDADWMLRPRLQPAFDAVCRLGLTFDALVKPVHLDSLLTLLRRHPDLPTVIDHAAKPDIANGGNDRWRAQMRELAALDHCHCKLSGLVTEAGDDPQRAPIQRYMAFLLECFGAEKLMWGSDWPVLNLADDYLGWRAQSERFADQLPAADRARIFGGTATAFYGLNGDR